MIPVATESKRCWTLETARAMLADFCTRLGAQGVKTIKTHFFLRRFYQKRNVNGSKASMSKVIDS